MSFRRSRVLKRAAVDEIERLSLLSARAVDRARGILDRVRSSVGDTIGPAKPARLQSEGSRRLLDFAAEGDIHDKRLWMPIAATTGAAGSTTCLVGTAEQVAESETESVSESYIIDSADEGKTRHRRVSAIRDSSQARHLVHGLTAVGVGSNAM